MDFLSPPNSNGLRLSTFQARTNPPLTRALALIVILPRCVNPMPEPQPQPPPRVSVSRATVLIGVSGQNYGATRGFLVGSGVYE